MSYLTLERTGDSDRPLVLLHALPFDKTMYDPVLPHLGDVITVSAPGFDGSVSGAEVEAAFGYDRPDLQAYARAVLADLDELGVQQFDLGGLSMGGPVATYIARFAPTRVESLILMDTNIGSDSEQAATNRLRAAEQADRGDISSVAEMADTMTSTTTKTDRPEVYRDLQARLERVPPAGLAWIQRAMSVREDQRATVGELHVPVLLVRGAEDASCSAEMMEALAASRDDIRLVTLADTGHFTALEVPADLARAISSFLGEVHGS